MRFAIGFLILSLLAVAAITRAACPTEHCVFIPFTFSDDRMPPAPSSAPLPSAAPIPSGSPAASTAPVARWTQGAPSPIVRSEAEGVAVDGKLYVFGGYSYPLNNLTPYSRVDVYDVGTDTWIRLRDLPHPVNHAGVATDGQAVYIAAGYVAFPDGNGKVTGSNTVFRYDIATDAYTVLPSLPLNRAAGALALVGRTLHFFGGTNQELTVDTGEHWALDLTNLDMGWQDRAPLPNPRNHLGAVELGGMIYAIGGQHGHNVDLVTQRDVHRYDPASDAWTAVAPLPAAVVDGQSYGRAHIGGATFVRAGKIVVAGGEYDHIKPLREVIEYDPATDRWQSMLPLPATRYSGVARQFDDKLIYVTGATDAAELTNTTLIGVP